jgi:hypothetical protein
MRGSDAWQEWALARVTLWTRHDRVRHPQGKSRSSGVWSPVDSTGVPKPDLTPIRKRRDYHRNTRDFFIARGFARAERRVLGAPALGLIG